MKVWTVQKILKWTEEYLDKRGVSSPRWEAEQLLAYLIDANRLDLYLDPHRPLLPQELSTFKVLLKRRTQGEPIQYITGRQGFWKHEFRVEPGVLIPRPDSEVLVRATLERLKGIERPRILDVGTGTGCLIISILADLPQAQGVATDINPQALRVAQENAIRIKVQDRLSFLLGDLLAPFKGEVFHAIISNPPYVAEEEWTSLPREVREQEPSQALKGGREGLVYLSKLIDQGWRHLLPGGFLAMEMGWQQRDKVRSLFKGKPYPGIEFFSDLGGRDRMVLAKRD